MKRLGILVLLWLCFFIQIGNVQGEETTYEVETQVFNDEQQPLGGVSFYLYKDGDVYIEHIESDAQGKIKLYDLPYGYYMLYQKRAPYGYTKMEKSLSFIIDEESKPKLQLKQIENKRLYGTVKMTLLDEENVKISGLSMLIIDTKGNIINRVKSDKNGTIEVEHMPVGTYYMKPKGEESPYLENKDIAFVITPYNYKQEFDMSIHLQKTKEKASLSEYSFAIGFVIVLLSGVIFPFLFFRKHSLTQFLDDYML